MGIDATSIERVTIEFRDGRIVEHCWVDYGGDDSSLFIASGENSKGVTIWGIVPGEIESTFVYPVELIKCIHYVEDLTK